MWTSQFPWTEEREISDNSPARRHEITKLE